MTPPPGELGPVRGPLSPVAAHRCRG